MLVLLRLFLVYGVNRPCRNPFVTIQMDINGHGNRKRLKVDNFIESTTTPPSTTVNGAILCDAIGDKTNISTVSLTDTNVNVVSDNFLYNDGNVLTDRDALSVGNFSTGVLSGGVLQPISQTQFHILAGTGYIIFNGEIKLISWDNLLNNDVFAGDALLSVFVDELSQPQLSLGPSTDEQRRKWILLGGFGIQNPAGLILSISQRRLSLSNPLNHLMDLALALGDFNLEGNVFGPNGNNMMIDKSDGLIYSFGANAYSDISSPSRFPIPAATATNMIRLTQIGNTGVFNTLDSTQYDLNGVLTPIVGGSYTVFRIYMGGSGSLIILQYGQHIYNSLVEAKVNIFVDEYKTFLDRAVLLRGFIIVKKMTVDLSLPENEFIAASRFGGNLFGG